MIKAILMDFNGVIIDDERLQMQAYQEILKEDGIDLTEEDYFASLGMDDRTFVAAAFARTGKDVDDARITEITDKKTDRWRELIGEELPLVEGIRDFVEKMSQEFDLGIVSMANRHEIDHVLEMSGLARHFPVVVSAADVKACKPDPECFRIGFRELDSFRTANGHLPMTHADCLIIEDSPPGIVGARSAHMQALGVTNTVSAAELRAAGAGAIASDLRDWMPDSIRLVFG